jgi:hypothetical protein
MWLMAFLPLSPAPLLRTGTQHTNLWVEQPKLLALCGRDTVCLHFHDERLFLWVMRPCISATHVILTSVTKYIFLNK